MAIPDYRIEVEEIYESLAQHRLVKCDLCGERVSSRSVHFMDSFEYKDTTLVICNRCYGRLNKEGRLNL